MRPPCPPLSCPLPRPDGQRQAQQQIIMAFRRRYAEAEALAGGHVALSGYCLTTGLVRFGRSSRLGSL